MRRWEAVGRLALVALVALGACSSGNDSSDGGSDSGLDQQDDREGDSLRAALVTVDDMPDGWREIEMSYTAVEACPMRTEMITADTVGELPKYTTALVTADRTFRDRPDAYELLIPAPTELGPGILSEVRRLLDLCGSGGEADGYAYLSVEELPLPAFGDESVARRVTVEEMATGATHGINAVYGRHGDLIVGVGVVEPPGETHLIEQLAELAFERASTLG